MHPCCSACHRPDNICQTCNEFAFDNVDAPGPLPPLDQVDLFFTNKYKDIYSTLYRLYYRIWSNARSSSVEPSAACNICMLGTTKLTNMYYYLMPFCRFSVVDAAINLILISGYEPTRLFEISPKDIIFHFFINCCEIPKSQTYEMDTNIMLGL